MPTPPYVKRGMAIPPTTTEIPQANVGQTFTPDIGVSGNSGQIVDYEQQPQQAMTQPQIHSLEEFMNEGDSTSPLGIEVREDRRKLKSGREAEGLLIVDVTHGSPAAAAGLQPQKRTAHDVLTGLVAAGSVFFPPAVLGMALIEQLPLDGSYDMIIGIDGVRVTNFLDFEDRMRDVQPGEIVYLSILRNGDRVQVPVKVPKSLPPPVF